MNDLRQALRSLIRAPGFALAALMTLGLGIGANTVVFSLVNGLLLRPLPFGDLSSRIVSLHSTHPTQFPEDWDDAGVSYLDMLDVQRESELLEDVAAHAGRSFTLTGDAEPERLLGGSVTPNLFSLLGLEPALGRDFRDDEGAAPGFESVVILSHGLWQSRYGGDPEILGKTLEINERELVVIGVMPPRFRFPERDNLWVPYDPGLETNRSSRGFLTVARLRPGVTLLQAREEVSAIANLLAQRYPETNRGWNLHLISYRDLVVAADVRRIASTLLVAVGLVLLIGCANLASLLLARGLANRREVAIRAALGAGRARLMREMLLESLLLGGLGGALGLLLSVWSIDAIVASFPEELPYWLTFSIDWRVALFVAGLSVVTSVGFGLLPALRVSSVDLTSSLGGSGRETGGGPTALRLQNALVVGQISLSLALLVGASLMIKSFLGLYTADAGFDVAKVLTFHMYLSGDRFDPLSAKVAFFQEATERLAALNGVSAAVATTSIPADDGGAPGRVVTPERPGLDGNEIGVQVVGTTPGLLDTLGLTPLEGRDLEAADLEEGRDRVAVINEALAEKLWPGESRQARQLGLVRGEEVEWLTVVGVAPNIQYEEFGEDTPQSRLIVYLPYSRVAYRGMAFLIRADDPGRVAGQVRETFRSFAPTVPAYALHTMDELRHLTTWEQRLFSQMFGAFAAAALLLACLGVYGLTAYRAGRSRKEVGIRMALGARSIQVIRLLVQQGALLAAMGLTLGLLFSLGMSRVLAGTLYGVDGIHLPLTLTMAIVLAASVVLATYLPARRLASTDPMVALREE